MRFIRKRMLILIVSLLFCLLVLCVLCLFAGSVIRIIEVQLRELVTVYPELEGPLAENFEFYTGKIVKSTGFSGMALAVVMASCLGCLRLIWKREYNEEKRRRSEELDAIFEQLQMFQKGNFSTHPYFLNYVALEKWDKIENHRGIEEWEKVHELLRELGYYFSDLKERLEEEENSTKALITDISHQLKTPLSAIRVSRELAGSEQLTEQERKDFLKVEEQEINKLEILLEELVNLSRLENNMIQVKPVRESIKKTIVEAVNQIFMKAYNKNIEICVDAENDVLVMHDAKWTVEALSNIMDNAVKYSPSGTSIQIRLECLPGNVLIEISDEGIGIQEDEIHKIFKRFYRGAEARELVKEGAGVGLYLSRSIIEQQGGTVVAKRKIDKGTIFKITLPILME